MAALEVLALNTVIPQIQAPQVGDSYLFPRVASFAAGTALLPSLAGPSDPDTGMWFPAANTIAWSTGGLEAMRINPNRRVGIGGAGNDFHRLTIVENSNNGASIICQTTSDTVAPGVTQLRARTSGSVQNGDGLGATVFQGYDGVSGFASASIFGEVDGVAGAGSVPTRLRFLTTPSGSVAQQERMRINATGEVGIGKTAATGVLLDVNGIIHGGERLQLTNGFANVSMLESASGVGYRWALANNGTYRLQRTANGTYSDATTPILFDASNRVGIGTTSPAALLHLYSTSAFQPQMILENEAADANAAYVLLDKGRSNAAVVVSDNLGNFGWRGRDSNGAIQNSSFIYAIVSTVAAGSVKSSIYIDASEDTLLMGGNLTRLQIKAGGQTRFVPLAADPTTNVQDGDVYYNSATNKLRVRAGGAWTDLH